MTITQRRRVAFLAGLAALPLMLGGYSVAGAQPASPPSVTVAVSPYRILDTRTGTGTGGAVGPVGAGQTITLQVAGVGPVPGDATGVVLNVTATEGTAASFVSAWPTGEAQPNASVLNVNPGQNLPNMITAALGSGGRLDLFNLNGEVHLVADVAGYLIPGSGGAQGPQGPPGDPGTVSGTQTLVSADWAFPGSLILDTAPGSALSLTSRKATIAVPELTQAVIDGGSVEVAIRPVGGAQTWTPLPLAFTTGAGWSRMIDIRYSVGLIELHYTFQRTDTTVTPPNLQMSILPDIPVRWVIRPGA